jgi:TM2 domain-containing membrane protein YozV
MRLILDTAPPTLTITSPTLSQRWSNAVFTVKGTAKDNNGVAEVWCLTNGVWGLATTANGWTNWTVDVALVPGTNVVKAYAVDGAENESTTNSVSFVYVVSDTLRVQATGKGTLSPNYSNSWLEIGRNYSMKATAGSGFAFTNWVISTNWAGGVTTNSATVQFMMQSNLTLQVNFADVTKPTITITSPTAGQKMTDALANVKGTASDNWGVGSVQYQLNGGAWGLATSTNGWTNWTAVLPLTAGTNVIKAYAVDLGGNASTTNTVSVVSSNTFNLRLGFGSAQPMASNGLQLSLEVSRGISARIEVSTNLVNWTVLTSLVGTNETLSFRDSAATNFNLRFYRAVTQ